MTPRELKNSIIRLAMQGRLVEQRSDEEPAQALLSRIKAEKKAKRIKPNNKVLPISEDDIPFDIPDNWCWVRFGDLVSYNMGKTPPRAEAQWWGNDVPWVSISDMPESGYITTTKERVSHSAIAEKFGGRVSKAGTMLMSFKLTVGRVSILNIDAVHNEAIISIYPICDDKNIIQKYLFAILPTVTQTGDSKNAIKGKTLNDTSISNLLIPLPPLAEQKRIVARIEELLPLVDRYEQAWNRLEDLNKRFPGDLQKSLLQLAIQGKLVEQRPEEGTGEELYQQIQREKQALIKAGKLKKEKPLPPITEEDIPFDIPESWKWVRLRDICNVSDGTHQTPKYVEKGIPFISAQNVKPYRFMPEIHRDISYEDYLVYNKNIAPQKGDILMTRVGAGIGEAAIVDQEFDFAIYVSLTLIKSISRSLCMKYLLHVLNSPLGNKLGKKKTLGKGSSQGNLNLLFIREFAFPIPPIIEQMRINAKLEELLPLCDKLK